MSCTHLHLSTESREITPAFQKDIIIFEQRDLLFTSPSKISDDIPKNLVEHFSDVFGDKPNIWKPKPPRTPRSFIKPQIIRNVHQKKDLQTNNALSQVVLKKTIELQPSLHKIVPHVEIPHILFQDKTSVWVVKSDPHRVLNWNISWNDQQYKHTTISDHLGNTYIDFILQSPTTTSSMLSIEIDDGSMEKIVSEHLVLPTDIHVEPLIQEKSLHLEIGKITDPNETPTLTSMYISYPHKDKIRRCQVPCAVKRLQRHQPDQITVHILDQFSRQTQQAFLWPSLDPIHPIHSIDQHPRKPDILTKISLHLPQAIHASDQVKGWIMIENPDNKSKYLDIIVLDKKRQEIFLKGRYEINESFQKISLQNIHQNTTDVSLYYAIDNKGHTSIHHSIDILQEFRTIHKNLPFQVYLDPDKDRKSIQFLFSNQEWGYIFFSRYEHIDILFQTLQWIDIPSTIDVQWQRILLGSLIWEDLYYGNIPIFERFRDQVTQDHKDLLEHIRSGLDDPYVFLALLVAQERGFYIPFDVFKIIKIQTARNQSSAMHLYLQFLLASTSVQTDIPKEIAQNLYKRATPSEKIWLIPILYTTQSEDLTMELNSKIIPYLSTKEKGILIMTLRKVKDMYKPSYQLYRDLKQNHFWELVGHAFFLQRKRKYKDSDVEIDIRENYKHILDGTVRLDNFRYVTYEKLQSQSSDVRITFTGKGMIRGGTLSFIEDVKEPVGIPVDLEISSTSSDINLQNGVLQVRQNDLISFTYTSTTPNIYIPPNSLLYPIQEHIQREDEYQKYHTTQIYKTLFCGEAYMPSASVYLNNNIGYSQSLHIKVLCDE